MAALFNFQLIDWSFPNEVRWTKGLKCCIWAYLFLVWTSMNFFELIWTLLIFRVMMIFKVGIYAFWWQFSVRRRWLTGYVEKTFVCLYNQWFQVSCCCNRSDFFCLKPLTAMCLVFYESARVLWKLSMIRTGVWWTMANNSSSEPYITFLL